MTVVEQIYLNSLGPTRGHELKTHGTRMGRAWDAHGVTETSGYTPPFSYLPSHPPSTPPSPFPLKGEPFPVPYIHMPLPPPLPHLCCSPSDDARSPPLPRASCPSYPPQGEEESPLTRSHRRVPSVPLPLPWSWWSQRDRRWPPSDSRARVTAAARWGRAGRRR